MQITVVGTNHKRAPIEVREKIAFEPGQDVEFLEFLAGEKCASEAVVLSTCNRTEIYAAFDGDTTPGCLLRALLEYHGLAGDSLQDYIYEFAGEEAVRHLLKVSASLDSLVVGESEILSQVKSAYSTAKERGATGPVFNFLFQKCFKVAKQVRAGTGISRGKVSVSSVAVDLAAQKLGGLRGRVVLVIGSGKVGRLAARNFLKHGTGEILVANRTRAKAQALAEEVGGRVVGLERIDRIMEGVDIVVGCTSARGHVLHRERCFGVISRRGGKPLFILDLGVPRNVDPNVANLDGVHLFNIDQLEEISLRKLSERRQSAQEALAIVESEVGKVMAQLQAVNRGVVVAELVAKFEAVREREVRKSLRRMGELTEGQKAELEYLTKRVVGRILHGPLSKLKPPQSAGRVQEHLETLQFLFG